MLKRKHDIESSAYVLNSIVQVLILVLPVYLEVMEYTQFIPQPQPERIMEWKTKNPKMLATWVMAFDPFFERHLQVPNFHTEMYSTARQKD